MKRSPLCRMLVFVVALVCSAAPGAAANGRTFVLMLFDGFSPRYVEGMPTPAFDRMRAEGAWSHAMDPAFPTISLINGVTISTGCWPAHHGIVSNLFVDPVRGLYDHESDSDWLLDCEHLHQAAERQQVATAALGWYGRLSGTRGEQASFTPAGEEDYEHFPTDDGRVEQVLELLEQAPTERPRLILAYFKGPDGPGHFAGMEADVTRAAVTAADAVVGKVLDAIDAQADASQIQLLVTTDHGMVPVEQLVNIRRILRRHEIEARAISSGTSSFLYFDDPSETNIESAMRKLERYSEFDVHRRSAQPADWHIGTGPRVGELIVSAAVPYFIEDPESWPWYIRWLAYVGPDFLPSDTSIKATHGYPTGTPGVEGILYTRGSAFAAGRNVEHVRAIDIHPTVMHVLGLEPGRPVDGVVDRSLLR